MKPLAPAAALHALVARMNPLSPVEMPLEEAPPGLYLAETPPEVLAPVSGRAAATNGYGLPEGAREGAEGLVRGLVSPGGRRESGGVARAAEGSADFECWRFESGSPVTADVESILPVEDAVLVGEGRIRIERLPPRGWGIAGSVRGSTPLPSPSGARLDSRLRALLEARGARSVKVRPPFGTALAVVGDEIVDPRTPPGPGERPDLVGPWIEEGVARLGLEPVSLGIIGDHPDAIRDAILHLRTRRVDVLVFAGGLGAGVNDRTLEGLTRFEMGISFSSVALDGAPGLLFAKSAGLDIVGIGGKPLEAAATFDLFLRPALLARLGAPRTLWDWTLSPLLPTEPSRGLDLPTARRGEAADGMDPSWIVRPAALDVRSQGLRVRAWEPGSPFQPWSSGQEGWAVIERGGPGEVLCRYVPLG